MATRPTCNLSTRWAGTQVRSCSSSSTLPRVYHEFAEFSISVLSCILMFLSEGMRHLFAPYAILFFLEWYGEKWIIWKLFTVKSGDMEWNWIFSWMKAWIKLTYYYCFPYSLWQQLLTLTWFSNFYVSQYFKKMFNMTLKRKIMHTNVLDAYAFMINLDIQERIYIYIYRDIRIHDIFNFCC